LRTGTRKSLGIGAGKQHPHISCLVDIPRLYARPTKGRWKQFSRVGPPIDNGLQILIMSYRIRSIENNKKNISLNLTLWFILSTHNSLLFYYSLLICWLEYDYFVY
jgi:hypothetical protein